MTLEQLGLGSDPPNGSGRERGATIKGGFGVVVWAFFFCGHYISHICT